MEPVWKALASEVRREILDLLREGPRTTGALAEEFPGLTRFAVMQHLRVLEGAELVIARREGRERYNYLNPVPIQQLYNRWVARYMKPWTEALVSLQTKLETESHEDSA
jgi:DNA-binding transcriptional ArsR family regulator